MTPYYDDGQSTIYHGDCLDVLPLLGHDVANVVITDPPYGMAHRSGKRGAFGDCAIIGDADTTARDWVVDWWGDRGLPWFSGAGRSRGPPAPEQF